MELSIEQKLHAIQTFLQRNKHYQAVLTFRGVYGEYDISIYEHDKRILVSSGTTFEHRLNTVLSFLHIEYAKEMDYLERMREIQEKRYLYD